jgi:CHAT domain-containing protein
VWFICVFQASAWALPGAWFQPAVRCSDSAVAGPGIVVQQIKEDDVTNLGGLRKGDVLLFWSHGENTGQIELPFDLTILEIEGESIGPVNLQGQRGSQEHRWSITPGSNWWRAVVTRPNLHAALLSTYLRGEQLATHNQNSEAARVWIEAASSISTIAPRTSAWLFLKAADSLRRAQATGESEAAFEKAIAVSANCGWESTRNVAMAMASLADDDFLASLRYWQRSFAVDRRSNDLVTAWILHMMGYEAMNLGKLDEAADYNRQALAIWRELVPNSLAIADGLVLRGFIALNRDDLAEASADFFEALQIQQRIGAYGEAAYTLDRMAAIAVRRDDLATAEAYTRERISIAERAHLSDLSLASGLTRLALVLSERGDFTKASRYALRVLRITKKLDPTAESIASALKNLAMVTDAGGQWVRAEAYAQQALSVSRKDATKKWLVVDCLHVLGNLAESHGELAKAQRYYVAALEAQNDILPASLYASDILTETGNVAQARGRLDEAERLYRESLDIVTKVNPGSINHVETLAALANNLRLKNRPGDAGPLYHDALNTLDDLTRRRGGSDDARATFRAHNQKYYQEYADLLIGEDKPETAFNVLERSRARTLLETLAAAHVDIHKRIDPALVERERILASDIRDLEEARIRALNEQPGNDQIKTIEKGIQDHIAELKNLEESMRAYNSRYTAMTQPQLLSSQEVQSRLLDHDTILLEYSLGEERSFAFAVTPDSLQVSVLPKRAEIERSARRVYALLTARNRVIKGETLAHREERLRKSEGHYAQASQVLSRMILGAMAKQLGERLSNKRLLIVTDGALAYIPFAALPDPQTSQAPEQAGTPLVVNHEIVNLPSASVLAVLRQQQIARPAAAKAVAVLADPVFDKHDKRIRGLRTQPVTTEAGGSRPSGTLSAFSGSPSTALLTRSVSDVGVGGRGGAILTRLRYSRQEADAIMAVTPSGKGMEALDFAANRPTATNSDLSNYRVVHFATHGLLDSARPELSGLVLSLVDENGNPQDGFLGLQDIYNLNLPADLVVLSACETGLGKEINGEGVIGLTRGFMYAGASRVVASLWKVSDVATARLMASFYQSMENDGLAPAAALRAAQTAMWKQRRWRAPYYWAAFQIQGEWK